MSSITLLSIKHTKMKTILIKHALLSLLLIVCWSCAASTQDKTPAPNDWLEPFPPFRIAGNLYYVGSKGLASYLVTTPEGHILINSNLEAGVPLIRASVEKLGFRFEEIRVLLIGHSHFDHDAGSARIKELTGARYMVMEGDVATVESGGRNDFQYGADTAQQYPPAKVERVLRDRDEVRLGSAVLVARLTPGHTKGTTTWTMQVQEGGRSQDVVII